MNKKISRLYFRAEKSEYGWVQENAFISVFFEAFLNIDYKRHAKIGISNNTFYYIDRFFCI